MSESLYTRCVKLISQLYSYPNFPLYLFPKGPEYYTCSIADSLPILTDPVQVLWSCFRLGAPLCSLFNTLKVDALVVEDVSWVPNNNYPTKPCKESLYKFILACKNHLGVDEVGVSELYREDLHGFVKILAICEVLVLRIEEFGVAPPKIQTPFTTKGKISTSNDNKTLLLKEILETERTFVDSLEKLSFFHQECLKLNIVSREIVQTIFSNLTDLLDFQRRFLVSMEGTLNLGPSEHRIGQLFIEEFFVVYIPFCNGVNTATKVALENVEALKKLDHVIQSHQIQSYLLKPVQRILKYPLLLTELIKLTRPEDYAYTDELSDGLKSIKRVTEKLNEEKRRQENENQKWDLFQRVEDWKGLYVDEFGDLILQDKFTMLSNDQEREYYVYLFANIITFFKETPKPKTLFAQTKKAEVAPYILKGQIFISSVSSIEDVSIPVTNQFFVKVCWSDEIESHLRYFLLKCRNTEQVTLWKTRMEIQVDSWREQKLRHDYSFVMKNSLSFKNHSFDGQPLQSPYEAAPNYAAFQFPQVRKASNHSNEYPRTSKSMEAIGGHEFRNNSYDSWQYPQRQPSASLPLNSRSNSSDNYNIKTGSAPRTPPPPPPYIQTTHGQLINPKILPTPRPSSTVYSFKINYENVEFSFTMPIKSANIKELRARIQRKLKLGGKNLRENFEVFHENSGEKQAIKNDHDIKFSSEIVVLSVT